MWRFPRHVPHFITHLYPCYFRIFHEINHPVIGLTSFQETFIWFYMVSYTHSDLGLKKYTHYFIYPFKGYPHILGTPYFSIYLLGVTGPTPRPRLCPPWLDPVRYVKYPEGTDSRNLAYGK